MNAVTLKLPDFLLRRIEQLSRERGFSVEQFLASAAAEKLDAMLDPEFLEKESRRGSVKDYEEYLSAVPDVPATPKDIVR